MSVTAGDIIEPVRIYTRDPSTGALSDRAFTAVLWVGDTASDTVVTLTNVGMGKYQASFTVPEVDDGSELELVVTDTLTGEEAVEWQEQGRAAWQSDGDYRYTTEEEVRTFLDSDNFTTHTDADRDGDSDAAAVEQGIRTGESEIDVYLGGPVESFTDDTAGESAAALLNSIAYKLAAYNYAAKRGFRGLVENEFLRVREEALALLEKFAANTYGVVIAVQEDEAAALGVPTVALSDGSAATASDLPTVVRPYGYRPYVWP